MNTNNPAEIKNLFRFYAHIRKRDFNAAARILLQYTRTTKDPQDWLSNGDTNYMLSHSLYELAGEWDYLNALSHMER